MFKSKKSKGLLAVIAVVLVWSCIIGVAYAAGNATGSADVTNSNASTLDKTVTATPTESQGCTGTSYSASTATMTVKNSTDAQAIISFDYEMTGASFTVGGASTTTTKGTYSSIMASNATVVFVAKNAGTQGTSSSVHVYNFSVVQDVDRTLTFNAAPGGTITVDGTTVTTSKTVTTKYSTGVAVTASPASGYTFYGWVDADHTILTSTANTNIKPTADATITPLFIQDSSATAYWGVGSKIFDDLSDAITAAQSGTAKKVVLLRDGTLPAQSYTIPSGIAVLIPFDDAGTLVTATPEVTYNAYTTPTAFRTLTMSAGASITVESGGALSLGSKLSSKGQLGGTNGCPTGPDGRIQMMTGSNITVENGGNLYCWGYIYGSGDIEAKNGATVYEAFQVKDWRGGTATSNVYDYAFIFNQYYIQNVEVAMKIDSGAQVKLYSSVNASSSAYPIGATLIGKTTGMFRIASGYIIKDYNEGKDQLNLAVYGTVTMNPLEISGVPILDSVSTEDYRLPVNNMNIDIQSGSVSLQQDCEFLPCAEVYVSRDAAFNISNGKKVYLYDADDWGNFCGSARLYAVGYSVANGTNDVRTADNLRDARVDVDGTMAVTGSGSALFTSSAGADIMSSNGYDGTNGVFTFGVAPTAQVTIYEMANNSTKTAVTFTAPKLHNGDDSYSETQGTGTSTWKYDKPGEHWYRYLVDFEFNSALIQREFFCENGDTVTYDAGWLTNLGATATNATATVSGTNVNVTNVTNDSVVTLTGTPAEYIPTFVLNEKQYSIYRLYTGNTITDTATIGDATYYIVDQASAAMAVGTAYAAPTDADMGVTAANHNDLIWNMSGLSYTSGDPYRGTVPAGETAQGPVYIYGFYDGFVAYNSYTDEYYRTLIDAFADTPTDATATITLLADCGTFEEELGTQAYSSYPNNNITLDLNGHKALGRIINQGTFTLELNGGTFDYHTGATAAAAAYAGMATIINSGNMTIQDSVGDGLVTTDAISNNKTVASYSACVRNNDGGNLTITGGKIETTQTAGTYSAAILNISGGTIRNISGGSVESAKGCAVYNLGGVTMISGGTFTTTDANSAIYNAASGTIDEISGGTIHSGSYGISNAGSITEISNCTVDNSTSAAIYNTKTIGTISGGNFTSASYALYNYNANAVINNISGGTFETSATHAVYNRAGTITTISGGTIISTKTGDYYALYNTATIGTISGGSVTGAGKYAVYSTSAGRIDTVSGGVFTATTSGKYAFRAANTTNKTHITGGYFLCSAKAGRAYGIYSPDNTNYYIFDDHKGLSIAKSAAPIEPVGYYYITDCWIVTFNANADDATGSMIAQRFQKDQKQTLTANGFARTGYTFGTWNTKADGTGTSYADKKSSFKPTQDMTLYAQWTANTYTVAFDANGGGGTMEAQSFTYDVAQNLTANAFTRDGYAFTGWNTVANPTEEEPGVTYANEASVSNLTTENGGTITLYAQWTEAGYTVTWKDADGTVLETDTDVDAGTAPTFDGATPTKEGDAQYSYNFIGWSTDGSTVIDPLPNVTEDVTYIAVFTQTVNTYTVTWKNDDGTVLETDANVPYGQLPAYDSANPTKESDAQFDYTFKGWNPTISEVTGDVTYTATYNEIPRTYTITWKNYDGEVLLTEDEISYGATPGYPNDPPTKPATAQYSYTFAGWSTDGSTVIDPLPTVTGNVTYIAVFTQTVRAYTVTWMNGGTAIETDANTAYGTTPEYNGETPAKEGDAQYSYNFIGWSTDGSTVIDPLPTVEGDVTYIAVFTETMNTYTVQWVMEGDGPTEAEIKAAVDGVIADAAQSIYNDAHTEGDMAWSFLSHENLVKMHLDAGGVPTTNSSDAYIAKRIIAIVEGNSADFSAADALWDACKDHAAADFAQFTGYTSGDTGTVYSGLTAEQITALNSPAGGVTVLETDENVPYGTTPSYDGETPTKAGDAQYSYTFAGWSTDGENVIDPLPAVTGDTTYIAVFEQTVNTYTLGFEYRTTMSGTNTDKTGYTIKYTYGGSIQTPSIRYYNLDHWTLNGEGEYKTTEEISAAIKAAIDAELAKAKPDLSTITVKAFFVRQTYTLEIYNVIGDGEPAYKEGGTANVGRSLWINAPEKITQDGASYTFAYWTVDDGSEQITDRKTSYFNGENENVTVKYYAHYATDGTGGTTVDAPKVTVRDYFVEPKGDTYVVGMTLEVIAPTDTTNFSINTNDDGKYLVGFGYAVSLENANEGNFSKKLSGNWGSDWSSGTYVMRFTMPTADSTWYSYGFLEYTLNGTAAARYATFAHPDSTTRTDYDIMTSAGRQG